MLQSWTIAAGIVLAFMILGVLESARSVGRWLLLERPEGGWLGS